MKKITLGVKKNPYNLLLLMSVLVLYFLNNTIFKWHTEGAIHIFFICFFNDLMAPIFLLSYSNILLLSLGKEIGKLYRILIFCTCCGLVWEFVAPMIKKDSVTDIYDLVCYIIGGFLYWLFLKVTGKKVRNND